MAKFKVLRGFHSEGGKTYGPGEIVDSKSDLNRMNQPHAIKFAAVEEGKEDDPLDLEKMTVAELQAMAAEEKIDLEGAYRKADIIEKLTATFNE